MTGRKLKEKCDILMDMSTVQALKKVFGSYTAIPHHERIKIFVSTTAEEVKKTDGK